MSIICRPVINNSVCETIVSVLSSGGNVFASSSNVTKLSLSKSAVPDALSIYSSMLCMNIVDKKFIFIVFQKPTDTSACGFAPSTAANSSMFHPG
jgi:hypothetical protein